tara:strand:+ start:738 stop:992 length:255 start_codon:yes stop_codon:yes gene_type:complete
MALSCQTELLEACNWDEDELSSSLDQACQILQDLQFDAKSYKDIFILVESELGKVLDKTKTKIVMKIIETQRKEMIDLLNAPEV